MLFRLKTMPAEFSRVCNTFAEMKITAFHACFDSACSAHAVEKCGRFFPKDSRTMAAIPAKMTAIGISKPGGPDMLVPEERPVPQPGEGEVLVKVAAAGVNRPD